MKGIKKHAEHNIGALQFSFSTSEGYELAVLLETLLFASDAKTDLESLEAIYDRLNDEMYLARWKREDVLLDLSMTELVALNKALLHAGGSSLAKKFQLTGELRCCLITAPTVDREYRTSDWS